MSRSGYDDDDYDYDEGPPPQLYRQAVANALRGKRGQAFLRELIAALDALPEKILVSEELEEDGHYCALGAVGRARGYEDMAGWDVENPQLAKKFGIAESMWREIVYENDDGAKHSRDHTAHSRWRWMRAWAVRHLIEWEEETPDVQT